MTALIYVVKVRGLIPESLPRKIAEAQAGALKSKDFSRSRCGPGVITSKTAGRKKRPTDA